MSQAIFTYKAGGHKANNTHSPIPFKPDAKWLPSEQLFNLALFVPLFNIVKLVRNTTFYFLGYFYPAGATVYALILIPEFLLQASPKFVIQCISQFCQLSTFFNFFLFYWSLSCWIYFLPSPKIIFSLTWNSDILINRKYLRKASIMKSRSSWIIFHRNSQPVSRCYI